MTKFSIYILFILTLLINSSAVYAVYLAIEPSYDSFSNRAMSRYNAKMQGMGVKYSVGFTTGHFGLEVYGKSNKLTGKIKHDSDDYSITQNENGWGAIAKILITRTLSLNIGYGFHTVSNSTSSSSHYTEAGIMKAYNLFDEQKELEGMILGANMAVFRSSAFNISVEYNRYQYTAVDGVTEAISLNLKYNFDMRFDLAN